MRLSKFAGLTAPAMVTLITTDMSTAWAGSMPEKPNDKAATNSTGKALYLLGEVLARPVPDEGLCKHPTLCHATAETLLIFAGRHLLTPALWSALAAHGLTGLLPSDFRAYAEATHALNSRRNARLRDQAREIAAAMNAAEIYPVFLKGLAHLLIDLYGDPAARFIGDIDVLVRRDRLEDAAVSLAQAGYRRLPDGAPHAHDLIRLAHPARPAMVELHQCPVALAIEAVIPAAAVIERAIPIAGLPGALVPCPEDLIVHNVAHAMLQHHFFRLAELPLRDAHDLVLMGEHFAATIDWPVVERRLAIGPGGADVLAFYAAASASTFPGAHFPVLSPGDGAARVLQRWRRRRGRPPRRWQQGLVFLREYAEDRMWRLNHVPGEWRLVLARLFAPHTYYRTLMNLAGVALHGPPTHYPGRRRTTEPTVPS